jgi:hypothetical protein
LLRHFGAGLRARTTAAQGTGVSTEELRIPKKQQQVTLWVHPEGRVVGSLFLREQDEVVPGEDAIDVLNAGSPFVVLLRKDLGEPRFYNKRSIVRVEHDGVRPKTKDGSTQLLCRMQMMDGSYIEGIISEILPPEHSRLFDYINRADTDFVRVHLEGGRVCLVNKSYIVHVAELAG